MIFEKRKVPLMFFVCMVFLYFPFYYAQYSPNPTAVVLATILFALVYCSLFYTGHKLYSLLGWFYLIGYIAVMSFWGNLQFSLFIFNLSNMLSWYYKENRPTYRTVSYGLLLLAIILWALFGPVPFEMRAFALVIHFFGLALLIFSWIQTKRKPFSNVYRSRMRPSISCWLRMNGTVSVRTCTTHWVMSLPCCLSRPSWSRLSWFTNRLTRPRRRWQTFRSWPRTPCKRSVRLSSPSSSTP